MSMLLTGGGMGVLLADLFITQMTRGPWKGPSTITKTTLLEVNLAEQV